MQEKVKKNGWKHLFRPSEPCEDDFEVAPFCNYRTYRTKGQTSRLGNRPGPEDPEKSKVIDAVLNRLRH